MHTLRSVVNRSYTVTREQFGRQLELNLKRGACAVSHNAISEELEMNFSEFKIFLFSRLFFTASNYGSFEFHKIFIEVRNKLLAIGAMRISWK